MDRIGEERARGNRIKFGLLVAEKGFTDCVRVLLESGAGASSKSEYRNAIKCASNLEIVKLLVDAGEDLSQINDEMRQLLNSDYILDLKNMRWSRVSS